MLMLHVNFAVTLSVVTAAVSAYVALLARRFARAPGFSDQRWFTLAAGTGAVYTFGNAFTNSDISDSWIIWISSVQLTVAAVHVVAWLGYSRAHLRRRRRAVELWFERAVLALGVLAAIPGLSFTGQIGRHAFPPLHIVYRDPRPTPLGGVVEVALVMTFVVLTARYGRAWRRGERHAGLQFAAFVSFWLMAANDVLVQWGLLAMPYLLDAAVVAPVAAVAYSLTSRFADETGDLARLRLQLEDLVVERNRQLEQTREALHQAEKLGALGRFAAGVAHEVNNPAAVVSANLSYLQEHLANGPLAGKEVAASLEESALAVERIGHIVRQLLDASRLATQSARADMRSVQLQAVATEAARTARARLGNRSAVSVEIPAELRALGEEELLVQVVSNLVVNAVQAIGAGRTDGRVRVWAERGAPGVRLIVEDNGAGMAPETMKRLFEPFFTTKPPGKGTGLGLAVSRGFIMSMGGSLRFESELGRGTRAILSLQEGAPGADPASSAASSPARLQHPPWALSLLVVDDEPHALSSLRRLLEGRYQVSVAAGVEEALALIAERPPDIVLCDLLMPGGGGERLYRELEERSPELAARLVFLTGGAAGDEDRAFLANQPQPVLHKPLDMAALAEVVRHLRGPLTGELHAVARRA